ncbi:MAG: phage holin family protein [Candidatus Gracilibacteria bacterium]|nr:phage holin family protein [Candidatus Gracilibacteria bacterium]
MFTTGIIMNLLITTIAVIITAYVLPGVTVSGFLPALFVAILLGVINTFVRPILLFLTLPINILTIGLFTFVLNALIIIVISELVSGFKVDGFWWALLFSIILSIVNGILFTLV